MFKKIRSPDIDLPITMVQAEFWMIGKFITPACYTCLKYIRNTYTYTKPTLTKPTQAKYTLVFHMLARFELVQKGLAFRIQSYQLIFTYISCCILRTYSEFYKLTWIVFCSRALCDPDTERRSSSPRRLAESRRSHPLRPRDAHVQSTLCEVQHCELWSLNIVLQTSAIYW